MLQSINERVSGWVSKIIIGLVALTFVLFGANYYVTKGGHSSTYMEINNTSISRQEYEGLFRQIKAQFQQFNLPKSFIIKQVDNALIRATVETESAKNNGFYISIDQVKQALLNVPEFQEKGVFSEHQFERVLASLGFTPSGFFSKVQNDLLVRQQQFSVVDSSFMLPSEIKKMYQYLYQQRSYQIVTFDKGSYLEKAKPTEKAMKAYYEKNNKDFMSEETLTLEYVLLDEFSIAKKLSISDDDVRSYYQENQSSFIQPAQYKIAHILLTKPIQSDKTLLESANLLKSNLDKGQSFAKMANEYSGDLLATDGQLPEGDINSFPKSFATPLTILKPGETSKPFQTEDGIEIVKLISLTPEKQLSLEASREKIMSHLKKEKVQAKFAELGEVLTEVSYQEPDSLEPVAQALSLPVKTLGPIDKNGTKEGLGQETALLNAAFTKKNIESGENSEPVQLDEGRVLVFRVKQRQAPKRLSFDKVKNKISDILSAKEASKLATIDASAYEVILKSGNKEKAQAFLADKKLTQKAFTNQQRQQKDIDEELNTLAFSLVLSEKATPYFAVKSKQLLNGDSVVMAITHVKDGDFKAVSSEEKASFGQKLTKSLGERDYALYIDNLIKNAKIKRI